MSGEFKKRLDQLKRELDPNVLARVAYPVFKENTPRRSGNAQDHTRLTGNVIDADYPYAGRLDEGYSKKKPAGMTKPTFDAVIEYMKKLEK
jgi:hypothetical protein